MDYLTLCKRQDWVVRSVSLFVKLVSSISVGERGSREGCSPPELGGNLLHSGNFPERTIGNSGNFSDFALPIRAEMLQPP